MKIDYTIDFRDMNNIFAGATEKMLKQLQTDVRIAGNGLALGAAGYTLPFGLPAEPPKKSKRRISGDIWRTQRPKADIGKDIWDRFQAADKNLAAAYWKAHKMGNTRIENKLLRQLCALTGITAVDGVDKGAHKRARTGAYGRVPKDHQTNVVNVGGKSTALRSYIDQQINRIGAAKAGWAAAGKSLGARVSSASGFPKWMGPGRHRKSKGTGHIIQTKTSVAVKLINHVPWADDAFPPANKRRAALRAVRLIARNMEKHKRIYAAKALARRQRIS